jgi:nucleoside-diphosphate-sugar epimerase
MRVLLIGATGAIGRPLAQKLVDGGHAVTGTTRSERGLTVLRALGVAAVVADVLDADSTREAVTASRPDAVVHQATDLRAGFGPEQLQATARVRTTGTRNVIAAMRATSVTRLIAQSAAWLYASGREPHVESDPLGALPGTDAAVTLEGIIELERLVLATPRIEGTVLRYGLFYGPGTVADRPSAHPAVHVDAAAAAAALAVDRAAAGVFNIVDDGESVSNALARRVLEWRPTSAG